jgi:hypothetical protein
MADAGEGAGEFHGLPREAFSPDEPAELEIRHTEQNADWDFRPWLSEKLNRMQTAAKDLVGVWITNPRFANERRCSPHSALRECNFSRPLGQAESLMRSHGCFSGRSFQGAFLRDCLTSWPTFFCRAR